MPYVRTVNRDQLMLCTLDSFVDDDSTARLIDAFVNSLSMKDYGIEVAAIEGRPSYNPCDLFKLYIYGYQNGIRSSRKLQKSCKVNIEVKWMLGGAEPDFRTIADFRKNNIATLKKLFSEFNKRLSGAVEWGFSSIDGSKFRANNSKNRNFTKNKLDDRITWLDGHIEEYLRLLDEFDSAEDEDENEVDKISKEIVEEKLKESRERLEKYQAYQKYMEDNNLAQLSLTDFDSKLMKSQYGYVVAFNPQTAVDSKTHLIRDFQMTNQVTDHGLIASTMASIKAENPETIIEATADKGYIDTNDMVECLENGIIPHVISEDGKDGFELEIPYCEASEVLPDSMKPEDLSKALHAGIIPTAYKDVISSIEIVEVKQMVKDESESSVTTSKYGSTEEMKEKAAEGYFVRDPERNLVICPSGEILRQKCVKKSGLIRFANKTACKKCPNRNKCIAGCAEWKEIDFSKDCLIKPCRKWLPKDEIESGETDKKRKKRVFQRKKVVRFFLKPSIEKTSQRMCLSEHPFGTIKRSMGATFFLLRGLKKVEGEFALMCLGYNLTRAKNLLGFNKMMEIMAI